MGWIGQAQNIALLVSAAIGVLTLVGGAIAWFFKQTRMSPAESWQQEREEREDLRAQFIALNAATTEELTRLQAQRTVDIERTAFLEQKIITLEAQDARNKQQIAYLQQQVQVLQHQLWKARQQSEQEGISQAIQNIRVT